MHSTWYSDLMFVTGSNYFENNADYMINLTSLEVTLYHEPIRLDADLSDVRIDEVMYKSRGGVQVPLTIMRSVKALPSLDSKPSQPLPVILTYYGGFGEVDRP